MQTIFNNIFSVKNNETHRIIIILGVKFKFKLNLPKYPKLSTKTQLWDSKTHPVIKGVYDDLKIYETPQNYANLIKNLDKKSIKTVNNWLKNIKQISESDVENYDPRNVFQKLCLSIIAKSFNSKIKQIAPDCFVYKKYKLPKNQFEKQIFLYRLGINQFKNISDLKEKNIIDAGAYIGDSSLILAEYTNKNVYAFEPVDINFNYLHKTLDLNNIKNVIPQKIGFSDKEETKTIYISNAASSINIKPRNVLAEENIDLTTLDEFVELNKISDIGLIKSDLEGFEAKFLQGALNTIIKHKPKLILSIYHKAYDFFFLKTFLEKLNLGYKFSILQPFMPETSVIETVLIAEINN